MAKKAPRDDIEPTDADALAAITAMQASYDKAFAEYKRAKGRAGVLKKAADEMADELFSYVRKLNEKMPLYDQEPAANNAPAAPETPPWRRLENAKRLEKVE